MYLIESLFLRYRCSIKAVSWNGALTGKAWMRKSSFGGRATHDEAADQRWRDVSDVFESDLI